MQNEIIPTNQETYRRPEAPYIPIPKGRIYPLDGDSISLTKIAKPNNEHAPSSGVIAEGTLIGFLEDDFALGKQILLSTGGRTSPIHQIISHSKLTDGKATTSIEIITASGGIYILENWSTPGE